MNTLELLITCVALSFDCFVIMMAKGAGMNQQEHRRSVANSLIFALTSLLMIVLGALAGNLIEDQFVLHVNQVVAALILFVLGCGFLVRALRLKRMEERHDSSFTYRRVAMLALMTSIDIFLLGTCMSLLQVEMVKLCLISTLVTLVCVELAQQIGYRLGMAYQRSFFIAGSAVLIFMSVKILTQILPLLK